MLMVKVFQRKETDYCSTSPPSSDNLARAATVAVEDIGEVFQATNSITHPWWQNSSVVGAATRSTSVGDIYHAKADFYDGGLWYVVLPGGLERIEAAYPTFAHSPLYLKAIDLIESWLTLRTTGAIISAARWQRDCAAKAYKLANDLHWFTTYYYPDSPLVDLIDGSLAHRRL
jgi:hypothetical protein